MPQHPASEDRGQPRGDGREHEVEALEHAFVVEPRHHLMLDADSHASIYDGSRLGMAEVIRFRHNNPDDLYKRLIEDRESFWTVVYPLYMQREITRGNVRDLVRMGLEKSRGNYKIEGVPAGRYQLEVWRPAQDGGSQQGTWTRLYQQEVRLVNRQILYCPVALAVGEVAGSITA